jgi:O-antigen ligase
MLPTSSTIRPSLRRTRRDPVRPSRGVARARLAVILSTVSCIPFFIQQDGLGFIQNFDYTQAAIQASALALGLAFALLALPFEKLRRSIGPADYLIAGFILCSLLCSGRSWNPALSLAHGLCYAAVVFNVRVALQVAGVRGVLSTLYKSTCLVVVAGVVAAILAPQTFPLLTTLASDRSRERLMVFQFHPILTADLMVLNLIVGLFIPLRLRWAGQLLCSAALLLTASRASVGCGGLIVLLCAFYGARKSGRWRGPLLLALFLGAAGAVIWLALNPQSLTRALFPTADSGALMQATSEDQTLNGRLPLWGRVIGSLSAQNLMGFGFYGYRKWIFELSGWAGHAHNFILDAILTGGYFAGAFLLAYVAYSLLRRRSGPERAWSVMTRCLVLYAFLIGMMGPTLEEPYMIMYVLAGAYTETAHAMRARPRRAGRLPQRRAALGLTGAMG